MKLRASTLALHKLFQLNTYAAFIAASKKLMLIDAGEMPTKLATVLSMRSIYLYLSVPTLNNIEEILL